MKRSGHITVGLVGPLPPPSGGMANQTLQLARLLRECGIGVEMVQVNAAYGPVWIGHVPIVRALFRLVPYVIRLWRAAGRADLFHVMANSGWAWHLFAAPAVWVARVRGTPVIINYRGGQAETFFERAFTGVKPTLGKAAAVVVPSAFLQAIFRKWKVQTEIVPNIIDLTRFKPGDRREGRPHLVVARNLEDLYDIPTAIRAFDIVRQSYPEARLSIAGSGPQRSSLESLCRQLGLENSVRFTGRLDNAQMPDFYRQADVALNPSLADNMPISLLEAMASGVPVVSTNVGGIPYLVADEVTALLVPPQQPEAMARAALRVLSDASLAERLRLAGLAHVKQFTWTQVRERLLAVYARVLGHEIPLAYTG